MHKTRWPTAHANNRASTKPAPTNPRPCSCTRHRPSRDVPRVPHARPTTSARHAPHAPRAHRPWPVASRHSRAPVTSPGSIARNRRASRAAGHGQASLRISRRKPPDPLTEPRPTPRSRRLAKTAPLACTRPVRGVVTDLSKTRRPIATLRRQRTGPRKGGRGVLPASRPPFLHPQGGRKRWRQGR